VNAPLFPIAHGGFGAGDAGAWVVWLLTATMIALVAINLPRLTWRRVCSFAGLAVVLLAFLPPLEDEADTLLSVHMGQHMLLMLVAAPLLAAGRIDTDVLLLVPKRWRWQVARAGRPFEVSAWFTSPLVTGALFAVVLWAWHVPSLYDLAVRHDALHAMEHASFLLAAWLFWRSALTPLPRFAGSYPLRITVVFLTMLHSSILAVLLTFAREPWYSSYAAGAHGLSGLDDQQLAGALMWVGSTPVFLVVFLWLGYRWLTDVDPEANVEHSYIPSARPEMTG
jgi:cytochrome c oxidase assembly factor CtaG